ncbi:MAG TPA: lysophospholipid acyltransferase family protein [Chitinophagales bacterium]|nr:lysophospholipid acyltransferase family protein [Chitinophagales bacterium]
MISGIGFYAVMAFVYPLSLLPLSMLYFLSDIFCFFVFYVANYRKKIVLANLRNSFPEKTEAEIRKIAKRFYRNLCDLIVENIKLVNISPQEAKKRCVLKNRELLDDYFRQGKSVIAAIGHCGNWELAGLAASLAVKHHCIAFYRTLKNPFFDSFAKKMRAKFGMELLPHTQARKMLRQESFQPNLYIFITDQTPSNEFTSYWLTFLNQDTPVYKGTEKVAKLTGLPVVFGDIQRLKRGYYSIDVSLLTDNPALTREGEITELHTQALEQAIIRHPDNWLWTHRRWKRKKPEKV